MAFPHIIFTRKPPVSQLPVLAQVIFMECFNASSKAAACPWDGLIHTQWEESQGKGLL